MLVEPNNHMSGIRRKTIFSRNYTCYRCPARSTCADWFVCIRLFVPVVIAPPPPPFSFGVVPRLSAFYHRLIRFFRPVVINLFNIFQNPVVCSNFDLIFLITETKRFTISFIFFTTAMSFSPKYISFSSGDL